MRDVSTASEPNPSGCPDIDEAELRALSEYAGGGYFRSAVKIQGKPSPIRHAPEVRRDLLALLDASRAECARLTAQLAETTEVWNRAEEARGVLGKWLTDEKARADGLAAQLAAATARAGEAEKALTAALPFVESAAAEDQSYGYFLCGMVDGDPRRFSPDEECATPAEIAQHKADCEAWDRGERPVHRVMTPIDPARSIARQLRGSDSAMLERDAEGNVTGGHVHRAGYGLGVTVFRDPEAVAAMEKAHAALASLPAAPAEEPTNG